MADYIKIEGSDKYIASTNEHYVRAFKNWGETHKIIPIWGTQLTQNTLTRGKSVIAGDLKTFHFLLIEK